MSIPRRPVCLYCRLNIYTLSREELRLLNLTLIKVWYALGQVTYMLQRSHTATFIDCVYSYANILNILYLQFCGCTSTCSHVLNIYIPTCMPVKKWMLENVGNPNTHMQTHTLSDKHRWKYVQAVLLVLICYGSQGSDEFKPIGDLTQMRHRAIVNCVAATLWSWIKSFFLNNLFRFYSIT